jgi:hypothetical protein
MVNGAADNSCQEDDCFSDRFIRKYFETNAFCVFWRVVCVEIYESPKLILAFSILSFDVSYHENVIELLPKI